MELTREQAIEDCKALWDAIEKSGCSKEDFLMHTYEGEEWLERYPDECCPLCVFAFTTSKDNACDVCLLTEQYGKGCTSLGYDGETIPTQEWLYCIWSLK